MTDAAADTLLSNSTASLGSIGSTQRSEMPALNPASARSRIASRLREASLGRKPLDSPAASASRIKQAVVQPVGAALPLQVRPEEHQARGGARVELAPLAAAVVRVEDEAAALDAFQEHRPSGGCARF